MLLQYSITYSTYCYDVRLSHTCFKLSFLSHSLSDENSKSKFNTKKKKVSLRCFWVRRVFIIFTLLGSLSSECKTRFRFWLVTREFEQLVTNHEFWLVNNMFFVVGESINIQTPITSYGFLFKFLWICRAILLTRIGDFYRLGISVFVHDDTMSSPFLRRESRRRDEKSHFQS